MAKKQEEKISVKNEAVKNEKKDAKKQEVTTAAGTEGVQKEAPKKGIKPAKAEQPPSVSEGSGKSIRNLLYIVLAFIGAILLALVSAGVTYLLTSKTEVGKCDDKCNSLELDYQTCLSTLDGCSEELDECEDGCVEAQVDCDCSDPNTDGPVKSIRIGEEGVLRLPSSWTLSGVDSSYEYLTNAEEDEMIKSAYSGLWPIFESTTYTITPDTDSSSVLAIEEKGLFIPAATGFMPDELTGEFEVLSEEANENGEIAVRIPFEGGYKYLLVYDNPDYGSSDPMMYSPDIKYVYFDLEYPTVTYDGSEDYLEDVDQIYIEACLRDSMKLCRGSVFE